MATDNSPPKIRVILTIAFSSVVILTALNFVFKSYYQMMVDEVQLDHLRPPEQLLQLREGEKRLLTTGAVPIENAIKTLAQRGRDGAGKDIEPQPSADLGAMVGWARAPNDAMAARADRESAAAAAPLTAPVEAADAGAPVVLPAPAPHNKAHPGAHPAPIHH